MTSTSKVIVALIIVGAIGIFAYRMNGNSTPGTYAPTENAPQTETGTSVAPATGKAGDIVATLSANADNDATVATNEDVSDLTTTDSQAVGELSSAYDETKF